MVSAVLWIMAGAFVVGLGLWAILQWRERKRTAALARVAVQVGMSFHEEDESLETESFNRLPLFEQGHSRRFRNVARGDGMLVFGYRYTSGHGQHQSQHSQTVAALEVGDRDITSFQLSPETLLDKIGAAFGGQDIDFEEDPEFSRKYRLRGSDEAAVRGLFPSELRQQLVLDPGWCLECGGDSLVLYRSGRVSPDDLASFIERARLLSGMISTG